MPPSLPNLGPPTTIPLGPGSLYHVPWDRPFRTFHHDLCLEKSLGLGAGQGGGQDVMFAPWAPSKVPFHPPEHEVCRCAHVPWNQHRAGLAYQQLTQTPNPGPSLSSLMRWKGRQVPPPGSFPLVDPGMVVVGTGSPVSKANSPL